MKALLVLVLVSMALTSLARAEDFTMTRGYDNKVFYCSDIPGGGAPTAHLTVCDCIDRIYNYNYGQLVGTPTENLGAVCKQQSSNGILKNCSSPPGLSATCECVDRIYNYDYGQVLGSTGAALISSCKQFSANGVLKSCQFH